MYKIFSWAYRIILGLITIGLLVLISAFSGFTQYNDNSALWLLLYSIITLTVVTVFHELDKDNNYRIFIQLLACILVLLSLSCFTFVLFSILTDDGGTLLINSITLVSITVNGVLLFYLVQDKKYNHN